MKNTAVVINILFAVIIVIMMIDLYSRPQPPEQSLNYKQRYDSLQSIQEQQSRERLVFIRTIDSLNNSFKLVLSERNKLDQELKSISGRYDDRTPSELEIEMERRSNGN